MQASPTPPEYRRDPIIDRWVIIAPNRAARPNEFEPPQLARSNKPCPFCAGNESLTPHELAAYRGAGTHAEEPGWGVRVIPNKFPALNHKAATVGRAGATNGRGFMEAVGVHEVIIESPKHVVSITDLTEAEVAEALSMYRDRLLALQQLPHVRHGLIFKNVGPTAGASIEHTHSQLIGLPMVPKVVAEELAASLAFHNEHSQCIFCDLIERELTEGSRIVLDSEDFVAFCPFAARFPLETWLLPKRHASHFEQADPSDIAGLAPILRRCIEKIERAAGGSNYNYLIHSAPFDTRPQSHYHWHIEIFPRMTSIAGFEWATGQFINPVPPEDAAELLRTGGS